MGDHTSVGQPMESLPPVWVTSADKTLTEVSSPEVVNLLWSLQSWSALAVPLCWCLPLLWGGQP